MKKHKRIILIGRSYAGKTTLCQYIHNRELVYRKTQTVEILDRDTIDTPGEYIEQGHFLGALVVTAVDADVVVLVQSAIEGGTMFPPAFSSMFGKPSVGVVTKRDLASAEQVEDAISCLKMAGAEKYFVVSSMTGDGMSEFLAYLYSQD